MKDSTLAALYADAHGITHVCLGEVTDPEAHGGAAPLGAPEWQFSDAPPGERGCSADYADLIQGLRDFEGETFRFHF